MSTKKLKERVSRLMLLLILSFILQACISNEGTPTTLSSTSNTNTAKPSAQATIITTTAKPSTAILPSAYWQTDWLKGLPCRAPCFEGITPGQTSATEALELLQRNVKVVSAKISGESVEWKWSENAHKSTSDPGGRAFFNGNSPSHIINLIELSGDLALGEVIKAYGEPSHIRAIFQRVESGRLFYTVSILYLSQGFILFDGSNYQKPAIDGNHSFVAIGFFEPGMESYKKVYPGEEYRYIVPWKGYNTFDFSSEMGF